MKLPTAITTKHKIRDSKILSLYSSDAWSMEEIGLRFGISTPRVSQIISKNLHLLKINREREKIYRINKLKRILNKKSEYCPDKDAVDLLERLKEEAEGKSSIEDRPIDQRDRVIIIRETITTQPTATRFDDGDKDPQGSVSRSLSVVRV